MPHHLHGVGALTLQPINNVTCRVSALRMSFDHPLIFTRAKIANLAVLAFRPHQKLHWLEMNSL